MSVEAYKKYPANAILPVIHLVSDEQAVEMAGLAREEGAGGVFIIDHKHSTYTDPEVLAQSAAEVITAYPEFWVGINCLCKDAVGALEYFGDIAVDGIWHDNALGWDNQQIVSDNNLEPVELYAHFVDAHRKDNSTFFGGIAMKGRGYVEDASQAAQLVKFGQQFVDVVTTSGEGTGTPTDLKRLQRIWLALDTDKKLAVASGVTSANLAEHLKFADYVLLASSIETRQMSGIIDREKLRRVVYEYQLVTDHELEAMGDNE